MKEGVYFLILSEDVVIDLATVSDMDWIKIKRTVKLLIESDETKDVGKAYIAAFLLFAQDLEMLSIPFDEDEDVIQ